MIGGAFAALAHPRGVVQYVSFAAAYAALYYLCWALLIGPLRVLRRGRPMLSDRRRRHVGIWCGIFALIHVAAGLNVHFSGHFAQYFLEADSSGRMWVRHDAFGLTNDIGLLATFGTVLLLGLSNDISLRKLGVLRWKNLQRISYPLFGLIIVHAVVYQLLEHRDLGLIIFMTAMASIVAILRVRAFKVRRRMSQ